MMVISCNRMYMPFLAKALQYTPSQLAECILCLDGESGMPVAGVIYDGYNGAIIHAHIWVDAERKPCREWWAAIFDYPFNRVKVHKIIGQVNSGNDEARKLDEHFGFVLEATIANYYDDGNDLMVYTMTRDQCRVLNSKAWAKVVSTVMGVK